MPVWTEILVIWNRSLYPGNRNRAIAGLLSGLILSAAGCCSFGNRANETRIATARELTSHGLSALYKGHADEATRLLVDACAANPEDCRIRHHLATALVEQGQIDSAITQLNMAIGQSPDDPGLHVELGKLYLRQGQPYAARQQANLALQLNRQMATAWLLRGRSERAAGQLDEALDSLHRAAAYDGGCQETRLELAAAWIQKAEPLRALTTLEAHNSGYAPDQVPLEAVELTGRALVGLQQYQRASRLLSDATHREHASPDVWILLSRAQLLSGDPSSAQLTAISAQRAFPNDPAVAQWLNQLNSDADPSLQAAR